MKKPMSCNKNREEPLACLSVMLLGCDFVGKYTNTKIYKSPFSIHANVFFLQHRLMCICLVFGPNSDFVGEYTNTHYKMTRILFVYL